MTRQEKDHLRYIQCLADPICQQKRRDSAKRYRDKYPERRQNQNRNWYAELRDKVLQHLGNKCAVCDFDDARALQIDHVNGGGFRHRQDSTILQYYKDILEAEPGRFQLLCANHNQIKRIEQQEHRKRNGQPERKDTQ